MNIFLLISFGIYCGCSKELSNWDGSFEYPQHMIWLRNKKIVFGTHALLSKGLRKQTLNWTSSLHRTNVGILPFISRISLSWNFMLSWNKVYVCVLFLLIVFHRLIAFSAHTHQLFGTHVFIHEFQVWAEAKCIFFSSKIKCVLPGMSQPKTAYQTTAP